MTTAMSARTAAPFDHACTLVVAVEISDKSWVVGAHVPGSTRACSRVVIAPSTVALTDVLARLAKRSRVPPKRTVVVYEAGHTGFWLARLLRDQGICTLRACPSIVEHVVPRPTGWTWISCSGPSRACARWRRSRTKQMRTGAGRCASAKSC